MANSNIDFRYNKKIIKTARIALKMLCLLDFITFGLIQDRLVFQGEKIISLVKKSKLICRL